MKHNQKGITLIALVVTIVILIILAAVSMNVLLGNNGIIKKAIEAGQKTNFETIKEEVNIAWGAVQAREYVLSGEEQQNFQVAEELQKELRKNDPEATVQYNEIGLAIFYKKTDLVLNMVDGGKVEKPIMWKDIQGNIDGYIGLSKDGKIYLIEYGEQYCLSENSQSAFYEKTIEQITYNEQTLVARDTDGKVYTWGSNFNGQLGDGDSAKESSEQGICISDINSNVLYGKRIVDITCDADNRKSSIQTFAWAPPKGTIYAIDNEGNLYGWGVDGGLITDNISDNVEESYQSNPICLTKTQGSILYGKKIKQIWEDGYSVTALDENGEVYIWEWGSEKINLSQKENSSLKGKNIIQIGRGIALDQDGKVYTWGNTLGDGSTEDYSEIPICISDIQGSELQGKRIKRIGAGYNNKYVIDENGKVYSWGDNDYGELGYSTDVASSNTPVCINVREESIIKDKKIVQVLVCDNVTLLDEEGKVYIGNAFCLSQDSNSPIFGKKVVQLKKMLDSDRRGMVMALDEQGNLNLLRVGK